jgi:hypothetical protein
MSGIARTVSSAVSSSPSFLAKVGLSSALISKFAQNQALITPVLTILSAAYYMYIGASVRTVVTEVGSPIVGLVTGTAVCSAINFAGAVATVGLSLAVTPYLIAGCTGIITGTTSYVVREIIREKTPAEKMAEAILLATKDMEIAIYNIKLQLNKIKIQFGWNVKTSKINDNSCVIILSDRNGNTKVEVSVNIAGQFIIVDHMTKTSFGVPIIEIYKNDVKLTDGIDEISLAEYEINEDGLYNRYVLDLIHYLTNYQFVGQHALDKNKKLLN